MTDHDQAADRRYGPTATAHGIRCYMPVPRELRAGTALCLSGGGHRAAAFHLGALTRLNELGVLSQIDTISAVSGGSLAAGVLAAHLGQRGHGAWPAAGEVVPDWEAGVVAPLRRLVGLNVRTPAVLVRLRPRRWLDHDTPTEALIARYGRLISRRPLAELPARPRFVFCATDLRFRCPWTMESGPARIGSRPAGFAAPPPERWTIARAVAASLCFPFLFPPIRYEAGDGPLAEGAYAKPDRDRLVRRIDLCDGGLYDNLALAPVWDDHKVVLVSFGGPVFSFDPKYLRLVWRGMRYLATLLEQPVDLRKREVIGDMIRGDLEGAYWGVDSRPPNYEYDPGVPVYSNTIIEESISPIRVELDALSEAEIAVLENHGYLMAEIAVQRHAPRLVRRRPPPRVPHPAWMDERRVARALARSHWYRFLGRGRWWSARDPAGAPAGAGSVPSRDERSTAGGRAADG